MYISKYKDLKYLNKNTIYKCEVIISLSHRTEGILKYSKSTDFRQTKHWFILSNDSYLKGDPIYLKEEFFKFSWILKNQKDFYLIDGINVSFDNILF
jgi:hypothetical protein